MPILIIYLLQMNIALVLFYLVYRFVLQELTFFWLNRIFLLTAVLISTVYPFFDFPKFSPQSAWREEFSHVTLLQQYAHNGTDTQVAFVWTWITSVYWLGLILMVVRFAAQMLSLYQIHRQSSSVNSDGHKFRSVSQNISPFTFWQSIYLNPERHQTDELKLILEHERIHLKGWHTLDILTAEICLIFYWLNPAAWLIKHAVRENLEYIVDRRMLNIGIDRKAYQYSLLRASNFHGISMVNNYNFQSLKNRIKMMNKEESDKITLIRYMCLIPVVIILSALSAGQQSEVAHLNIRQMSVGKRKLSESEQMQENFNKQMNDPEFQRIQERAASQQLQKELEAINERENSPEFKEMRENFNKQMNDPEFQGIQARAASQQLQKELEDLSKRENSPEFKQMQESFKRQMNDAAFQKLQKFAAQ